MREQQGPVRAALIRKVIDEVTVRSGPFFGQLPGSELGVLNVADPRGRGDEDRPTFAERIGDDGG